MNNPLSRTRLEAALKDTDPKNCDIWGDYYDRHIKTIQATLEFLLNPDVTDGMIAEGATVIALDRKTFKVDDLFKAMIKERTKDDQ